ncbi:MAG: hypothetical protein HY821_17340 [Acidobacteria bacterium]|nr:hypothetical protein [Acidobacteriota bacterium]
MTTLFQRLDPRARVLTVITATVVVVSTPSTALALFPFYLLLCLLVILTGKARPSYLAARCLAASPFILLAAGVLAFQNGPSNYPAALTVAAKAYTAIILLAFLTASTPLADLLSATRRLGAPASLNLILGMMHRYTHLFSEEYARMERARQSRSVAPLGRARYQIFGRQFGELILRSWDRADRVHSAMLARGFTGAWPEPAPRQFGALEWTYLITVCGLFLAARFLA